MHHLTAPHHSESLNDRTGADGIMTGSPRTSAQLKAPHNYISERVLSGRLDGGAVAVRACLQRHYRHVAGAGQGMGVEEDLLAHGHALEGRTRQWLCLGCAKIQYTGCSRRAPRPQQRLHRLLLVQMYLRALRKEGPRSNTCAIRARGRTATGSSTWNPPSDLGMNTCKRQWSLSSQAAEAASAVTKLALTRSAYGSMEAAALTRAS